MADVVFTGIGATGFPAGDVQILVGVESGAEAEVTFDGPNEFSVGQGLTPTVTDDEVDATDPAEVEFFPSSFPLPPASTNPNANDVVFYADAGSAGTTLNVSLIASEGASNAGQSVPADLLLFAGPLGPSGLCGKMLTFLTPTAAGDRNAITPMTGFKATIVSHTNSALTLDTAMPGGALGPTLTDKLMVESANRTLRRTPVIEIILG
jgi:hypothetical protein